MADYFVGEIRMFSYNWAPKNWALCNGAIMQIQQSAALYSLLGIQFGGNGQTTFALPDLRGRVPLCVGASPTFGTYTQGTQSQGGVENVTLAATQVPIHTHSFRAASAVGSAVTPAAGSLASSTKPAATTPQLYGSTTAVPSPALAPLNPATLATAGGQSHKNMQPYLVMNFCIATLGIYPPRP